MTPAAILAALLSLYPRSPAAQCLHARRGAILDALEHAHRAHPEVPTGLLAAIGWHESHLGCARASGGCWGSPRDRDHRHTAGTPTDAARDLAHALRACGSTVGAIARFRGGSCRPGPHSAYVARVAALAARLGGGR